MSEQQTGLDATRIPLWGDAALQVRDALRAPTPVADDMHATAPELLARAAVDYRNARARRQRLTREDRLHGNETGGH